MAESMHIVEEETARFEADLNHRITGPTIQRLKQHADELKSDELRRLLNKLGEIDGRTREKSSDLREARQQTAASPAGIPPRRSQRGSPHRLLDALRHLFQIND